MTAAARDPRGLHLHFDCASGIAGDMTLAALLDLGVPESVIGDALDAIGVGRARLSVRRIVKRGIAAVDVQVETRRALASGKLANVFTQHAHVDGQIGHAHGHAHAHGHERGDGTHHGHHHWAQIKQQLTGAGLPAGVLARAMDMFERVARAEARLHGTTTDEVAFHEVGAIDSIVDIVGTAAALTWLAPAAVTCTEVAMGQGTLTCSHGVLPVPAPAALEILRDAAGVMASGGLAKELTTPTGAAILAHAVTAWTGPPTGTPVAVGWGAGDFELPDRANVVRVTAIAPRAATTSNAATAGDGMWRLEANIDDMSPELAGHVIERALAAGAMDAWWTPITMKKGRPAFLFGALASDAARDAVVQLLLRETTTIGVRFDRVERTVLARETISVDTEYGPIAMKLARGPDGAVWNAAPEHDDCVAAAARAGAPLKDVYAAATTAWRLRR
ncbi:MAG TPA: nickel pincer cofactor biosynthesis protein LarC [Kofleriaceae bacterium]|nr:nickel pincer cofactor biosynthesis protein LarC [Kofleriaceae bacterium]